MKYTIISRDEFLKLIKFGTIYQSINYIVEEKNKQKIISEILKSLPYDDPFGYVVVEFTYEENFSISNIQALVKLDIKDIINIYCLTNEALNFYKTKFNPNIKFKLFENQELIKKIDLDKLTEDKNKGIETLFDIFKLNLKDMNEKFNTQYIRDLLDYKENNYLEQEYKDFYFDMFCYERKNSFYKEDIGFIADIRAISKMKDIRGNKELFLSGNYQKLVNEKDRENIQLNLKTLIIDSIGKVNESDKKTEEEKKATVKELVVGAIFLKSQKLLNTESREQNYWESFLNFVGEFKEEFKEETKEALWYLGVFLGYKYLYDDYYNCLDLKIFKENSETNKTLISTEEEQESELTKLKHKNEELSKKIEELESTIQNNKVKNENIQDKEVSKQTDLIDQTKEENEQIKKQLEEIEQKNQELSQVQELSENYNEDTNKAGISQISQENTQTADVRLDRNSLNTMTYETLIDIAYTKRIEKTKKDIKSKYSNTDEGKKILINEIINNKNLINQ